ncbi:MAG: anhydro-N-acetylmuramic acid kinase [Candidatus Brocadiaceae bacterium]|nr:anhydro-N-acetylmuramic acid kinase [Candidatus Brocadiaceae bacterium]
MLEKLLKLGRKDPKKIIGLMSGTSADGIDACLVELSGNGTNTKINILAFETYPYDEETRNSVLDACDPKTSTVDKVCQLNFFLGKLFADAVKSIAKKAQIRLVDIDLIGSHGHTIRHLPNPSARQAVNADAVSQRIGSTLQIGEPSIIAQETGISTVADFRPRDMAAGGQGAPLVSYVDYLLFRDTKEDRALQNIGGIASLSFLPSNCTTGEIVAFDTGPGNMIIDRITEHITNNRLHFDEGGKLAATGIVNEALLSSLLSHPFLKKTPPKTTGREEFGTLFADKFYKDALHAGTKEIDILATVTAFTAYTIADSYRQWIFPASSLSEIIISGGGCRNATLLEFLAKRFSHSVKLSSSGDFGIDTGVKEALAFAILANETISGNANNVPHATGAKEAVVMGKIIP